MSWVGIGDRDYSQPNAVIGNCKKQQKTDRRVTFAEDEFRNEPGERNIGRRWNPPASRPLSFTK